MGYLRSCEVNYGSLTSSLLSEVQRRDLIWVKTGKRKPIEFTGGFSIVMYGHRISRRKASRCYLKAAQSIAASHIGLRAHVCARS